MVAGPRNQPFRTARISVRSGLFIACFVLAREVEQSGEFANQLDLQFAVDGVKADRRRRP